MGNSVIHVLAANICIVTICMTLVLLCEWQKISDKLKVSLMIATLLISSAIITYASLPKLTYGHALAMMIAAIIVHYISEEKIPKEETMKMRLSAIVAAGSFCSAIMIFFTLLFTT